MEELIEKFRKGKASIQEKKKLYQWLKTSDEVFISKLKEEFDRLSHETEEPEEKFDRILRIIHRKINQKQERRRRVIHRISKIAACLLLLFGLVIGTKEWMKTERPSSELAIQKETEIANPYSEKIMEFLLSDRSVVQLHPGAKIKMDSSYGKSDRKIQLEGKAYFTVAKNASIPFVVQSGDFITTALGTEFSVESDLNQIKIKLFQGKISIESADTDKYDFEKLILNPNQEFEMKLNTAIAKKPKNEIKVQKEEAKPEVVKKVQKETKEDPNTHILTYHKETLKNVIEELNKNYSEKILFDESDIQDISFTGQIYLDEPLIQTIHMICHLNQLSVRTPDENTLEIYKYNTVKNFEAQDN